MPQLLPESWSASRDCGRHTAGLEVRFLGAVRLEPSPEIKDFFRRMEAARQRAFTKSFRVGAANENSPAVGEKGTK